MNDEALAERYVIGALLRDNSVLRAVQVEVSPDDFDDARLGLIYAGIARMVADKLPVDYLTVADNLAGWDVLGIDVAQLAGWASAVPAAASATYYAAMVRRSSMRRSLTRICGQATATDDPGMALAKVLQELTALRDKGAAPVAALRSLREILDVPASEDEYDWVVPGLLERADRLMLTGGEGGGKSTLLRQIAVMAAAGLHPFSAVQVRPSRVLVVDAENSERQWRRKVRPLVELSSRYGVRDPRDSLSVEFVARMDVTRPADIGAIHRKLDEVSPDLVLIGPLYRLIPRAIKDDDDAAPLLAALDSIRDRGIALMVEAHAGHARDDMRPRGSSALLGWPEFGLGLIKPAKRTDPYALKRWRGDRDEREWPTELTASRYTSQTWPWEAVGGAGRFLPATALQNEQRII